MNRTASLSSWPRLCEEQRVLANVGFPKMGFTIFHRFAPVFILASNIFSTYCGYGSWRDCTWVMAGEEERLWQPWYKDFQRSHNGSGRDAPTEISRVSLETAKDSDTPMELCDMTTKLSTRSSTCMFPLLHWCSDGPWNKGLVDVSTKFRTIIFPVVFLRRCLMV